METREFLNIGEVADLLGTSKAALYTQRHRREAPGALAVRVGRRLLWRRADIDAWFDAEQARDRAAP